MVRQMDVSAGQPARRTVAVVPHTHWDREWYLPFQSFRLRLVELLDDLLPELEADPSYAHFLLDGQLAVVDDHLAVRPGDEDRLRRLNTTGRIAVGPWYTLPDEFLVSGETLIRDLQLGFETAAPLGGAMEVGYLPDMFGHIAQMPQLLRLFGIERRRRVAGRPDRGRPHRLPLGGARRQRGARRVPPGRLRQRRPGRRTTPTPWSSRSTSSPTATTCSSTAARCSG